MSKDEDTDNTLKKLRAKVERERSYEIDHEVAQSLASALLTRANGNSGHAAYITALTTLYTLMGFKGVSLNEYIKHMKEINSQYDLINSGVPDDEEEPLPAQNAPTTPVIQ